MDTPNNMRFILKALMFCSLSILVASCFYDKKDLVYPQAITVTCDTTNITYAITVATILKNNCNNCHAATLANANGAGIILDNYTAVKAYVTNGRLYNSIVQNGQASAMPRNAAKLDQCTINKIALWINKGAPNN